MLETMRGRKERPAGWEERRNTMEGRERGTDGGKKRTERLERD